MSRVLDDAQIMPRLYSACINNRKFQEGGLDVSDMLDITRVLKLSVADPTRNVLRQRLCEALYPEQVSYPDQEEEEDGFTKVQRKVRVRKEPAAAAAVPEVNDKVSKLAYELFNRLADKIDKILTTTKVRPPPDTRIELLKYKMPREGRPTKSDTSVYFGDVPYATLLKGPTTGSKGKAIVKVLELLNEQYAAENVSVEDVRNVVSLVYGASPYPVAQAAAQQRVEMPAPPKARASAWQTPAPSSVMVPMMFPEPEPEPVHAEAPVFTGRKGLLARTKVANPGAAEAITNSAYALANELADKIDKILEASRARARPYAYVEILRYQMPRKGNKPDRVYYQGVPYALLLKGPVERADTRQKNIVRVLDLLDREYAPYRVEDHYNYEHHRNEVYLVMNEDAWAQKLAKSRVRYESLGEARVYIKPDRAEGYAWFS